MKNLFVGNMSFQTTESDLQELFKPFGQFTSIHIVQDRETGQPRGFAFVEMTDETYADQAMSVLNGKEVSGRILKGSKPQPFGSVPISRLIKIDLISIRPAVMFKRG